MGAVLIPALLTVDEVCYGRVFLALEVDANLQALVLLGAVEGVESEIAVRLVYVELDIPLLKIRFEPCAALI